MLSNARTWLLVRWTSSFKMFFCRCVVRNSCWNCSVLNLEWKMWSLKRILRQHVKFSKIGNKNDWEYHKDRRPDLHTSERSLIPFYRSSLKFFLSLFFWTLFQEVFTYQNHVQIIWKKVLRMMFHSFGNQFQEKLGEVHPLILFKKKSLPALTFEKTKVQ